MGYYVIDRRPVFLSRQRQRRLYEETAAEKDIAWKDSSTRGGTAANREANALFYGYLLSEYKRDREEFEREWVRFDLVGEEARIEVTYLLAAYCRLYGFTRLRDLADVMERTLPSEERYTYPLGQRFDLCCTVSRPRGWLGIGGQRNYTVAVPIDAGDVSELVGDLTAFQIVTSPFSLWCSEDGMTVATRRHSPL